MSVESLDLADDLHVIVISGKLEVVELSALRARLERTAALPRSLRVLVILRDFAGWEHSAAWGEVDYLATQDQWLKRIAVVGEPDWREQAMLFMVRDLREVPIEYFPPAAIDTALRWLIEP